MREFYQNNEEQDEKEGEEEKKNHLFLHMFHLVFMIMDILGYTSLFCSSDDHQDVKKK